VRAPGARLDRNVANGALGLERKTAAVTSTTAKHREVGEEVRTIPRITLGRKRICPSPRSAGAVTENHCGRKSRPQTVLSRPIGWLALILLIN
jgi:hypothetical protein